MSYLEASALLAQDLGRLLCMRPEPPSYAGLQAALSGRAATLDLLVSVHREVAGQSPDAVQLTMADLGRHPVAVLGRALRDHPRVHADLSPTDVHALEQSTEAGRTWLSASRHALVAHHDWLGDWAPMTGDTAWSVLADVAALSRAIAVLDEGLVRDASHLHRPDVASRISPGSRGNLRLAASEALALARSGPLPEHATDRRVRFPLKVIPVSRPADLARGQRRLVELLQRVTMVRPEHAEQVAIANARTCLAVARLASSDAGQREISAAMHNHAALLGASSARPCRAASLEAGDPRPLQQAGEVVRILSVLEHDPALDLALIARNVLATTKTLAAAVQDATGSGRWLVPDPEGRVVWAPWRSGLREPTILTMLRAAAADADRLGAVAPAPPLATSRRALAAPHSTLSTVDALYGAVRPSAPTAVPGRAHTSSRRPDVTRHASARPTSR